MNAANQPSDSISNLTTRSLESRLARIERSNTRLRVSLLGVGMLLVGVMLGGLGNVSDEPGARRADEQVVAYTATDRTMYRIYESGRIEYLRLDQDPPRTADGIFNWGNIKIDKRYTLTDRP